MTYTTDSAEWPSGYQVPAAVKAPVDRLYSLLDRDASNVGDILANEIFTSDGVAFFGGSPSRGIEGKSLRHITFAVGDFRLTYLPL